MAARSITQVCAAALVFGGTLARAQQPDTAPRSKWSRSSRIPAARLSGWILHRHDSQPGGGPLAQLAGPEFVVLGESIVGGPDRFDSAHFDVQAKAEKPTTAAQLRLMLQRMLEERFELKWHREMRPGDRFAWLVTSSARR
jgi:hypothetical protein